MSLATLLSTTAFAYENLTARNNNTVKELIDKPKNTDCSK